jgi:tetratricopeptide (TPR) repeat protein
MRTVAALAVWLALAGSALAGGPVPGDAEDFSEGSLTNRVSVGVGMLRVGGDDEAPIPLEGNVILRATTVTRLIADEANGATFGYRIDVALLGGSDPPALRVRILPLDANAEKDLRRLRVCEGCPPLRLVDLSVRYPPEQVVRTGETIVIDLLERSQSGERIVDVVKFARAPVAREDLGEVRRRLREASRHVRRADALAANGSLEAAAAEYARALALQPDSSVHRRLGQCQQGRGRMEDALREYEKAVRLDAADAESRLLLSVLRHRRGDFGRAADGYRQVLKARPDWALARLNLATSHLDRGDVAQALEDYRQAHRSDGAVLEMKDASSVRARDAALQAYVIARAYAAEGDASRSLAWLERAVAAGFGDFERVRTDPEFAPLRQDSRFVGLLARGNRS